MYGFDLYGLLSFIKQGGFAVAGAAGLWGLVFYIYSRRKSGTTDEVVFHWIAGRLYWLMAFAWFTTAIARMASAKELFAHEGIILIPTLEQVANAYFITEPVFIGLSAVMIISLILRIFSPQLFHRILPYFLGLGFISAFILTAIPAWVGRFDLHQGFFFGHGFHSIFTLGTVIVLDFLFLSSKSSLHLKQNIFPFFSTISKVIWVGLAVDFISVLLVFGDAIELTPRFFFAQTVIGILIINGTLLAGPVTRMMLRTVKKEKKELSFKENMFADIAGTVSITSWFSITFIDYFHNVNLDYVQLMGAYILLLILLYVGHRLWEHFDQRDHRSLVWFKEFSGR